MTGGLYLTGGCSRGDEKYAGLAIRKSTFFYILMKDHKDKCKICQAETLYCISIFCLFS